MDVEIPELIVPGTEEGVLRVVGASAGIGPGTTNIGADASSAPGVGVAADTERIGAHAVSATGCS